jgi:hypothetical protein
VFWKRIRRETDAFDVLTFGVYGADLVALTGFFVDCYDRPVPDLEEKWQAQVLDEAAFDLRGLGRMRESIAVFERSLARHQAGQR